MRIVNRIIKTFENNQMKIKIIMDTRDYSVYTTTTLIIISDL